MGDRKRRFRALGVAAIMTIGLGGILAACNGSKPVENPEGTMPPSSVTPEQDGQKDVTPGQPEGATVTPVPTKEPDATPTSGIKNPAVVSYPTLYSDIPDLDIIRVGEAYYMTSTTMNLCPGVPVMKSKDLVHWQIVNYVYDVLEEDDYGRLENGKDMYARGSWAASLRYDEASGLFYVGFMSNNHGFYIYTTDDIENGTWKKYHTNAWYHDPGLFLEDGKLYVFSASGGSCTLQELMLDDVTSTVKQVGSARKLFSASGWSLWEGAHVYKIDGYYYVCIIASPADRWMRTQLCYRSDDLFTGDWEEKVIYQGGSGGVSAGLAQGGLVQTQFGDWYGFLFQDRGGIGRVPSIVAVEWQDGWPVMGTYAMNGKFFANESSMAMRIKLPDSKEENYFVGDDTFDYAEGEKLKPVWQWNHNPADGYWSVTEQPGFLTLTTDRVVGNIYEAHNSLTQRTVGPRCETETKLSVAGLKGGDYAGLCAMSDQYGMIGVCCDENGEKYLFQADGKFKTAFENMNAKTEEPLAEDAQVWLKISYDFGASRAVFSYSLDGENWTDFGKPFALGFSTSTTFMGTRSWLFCYATKEAGGVAAFDYYKVR